SDYLHEVPFDYSKGLILVDVLINGKTYNFVFDTGAELSVIGAHIKDAVDHKVIASAKVKATQNKSESKVHFIRIPSIILASVDFENTGAIIADLAHMNEPFGCRPIDGIIGNNLMRKAAWQIDYAAERLRVSDSTGKFSVSEQASALVMDAGRFRNVFFDVTIDSVSARFAFDTGSTGNILADSSFFARLQAKNPALEYTSTTGFTSTDLNGKQTGRTISARVKRIDIEGLVIPDQIILLSGRSTYLMGNEVYEHFILTIDWEHDTLFLDPTKPVEADTLKGFEIRIVPNFVTRQMEIARFQDQYPLADPIAMDAKILKINAVDVSHFTMDELCTYWEQEEENFRNTNTLDLELLDEGVTKQVRLTNKVLLPK
ncbi:MAG TPA: aspartyl protease family protein, partial [Flavobacteriales bacterium]|nr:aspartyl protease family protein [Flavobacteriales bacterium]